MINYTPGPIDKILFDFQYGLAHHMNHHDEDLAGKYLQVHFNDAKQAIERYAQRKVLEGRIAQIRALAYYSQLHKYDSLEIMGIDKDKTEVEKLLAKLQKELESLK